jgi:Fic family protein
MNYDDQKSRDSLDNYRTAFHYLYQHCHERPNLSHLQLLHKLVIDGSQPVSIGGILRGSPEDHIRKVFDVSKYPNYDQVPTLMHQFVDWLNQNQDHLDCCQLATHAYK